MAMRCGAVSALEIEAFLLGWVEKTITWLIEFELELVRASSEIESGS